jgi:hypothetical protein
MVRRVSGGWCGFCKRAGVGGRRRGNERALVISEARTVLATKLSTLKAVAAACRWVLLLLHSLFAASRSAREAEALKARKKKALDALR